MTWKEFKERVEAEGVKDEDEIWYIDVCGDDIMPSLWALTDIGWKIT